MSSQYKYYSLFIILIIAVVYAKKITLDVNDYKEITNTFTLPLELKADEWKEAYYATVPSPIHPLSSSAKIIAINKATLKITRDNSNKKTRSVSSTLKKPITSSSSTTLSQEEVYLHHFVVLFKNRRSEFNCLNHFINLFGWGAELTPISFPSPYVLAAEPGTEWEAILHIHNALKEDITVNLEYTLTYYELPNISEVPNYTELVCSKDHATFHKEQQALMQQQQHSKQEETKKHEEPTTTTTTTTKKHEEPNVKENKHGHEQAAKEETNTKGTTKERDITTIVSQTNSNSHTKPVQNFKFITSLFVYISNENHYGDVSYRVPGVTTTATTSSSSSKQQEEFGRNAFKRTVKVTINYYAQFVFATGHLHRGGLNIYLQNEQTDEIVFNSHPIYNDERLVAMEHSKLNYHVHDGDSFILTSIYDNSIERPDVMGIFLLYQHIIEVPQHTIDDFMVNSGSESESETSGSENSGNETGNSEQDEDEDDDNDDAFATYLTYDREWKRSSSSSSSNNAANWFTILPWALCGTLLLIVIILSLLVVKLRKAKQIVMPPSSFHDDL